MKIWLITTGEPPPFHGDRPHRTGILSEMLCELGHKVTWWTTSFDHQKKKYLYKDHTEINVEKNFKLVFLHAATPYYKNISLARIRNHQEISDIFEREARKKERPDIIFTSFPTIDLAFKSVKYGLANQIPVVVDVRDLWPDIFVDPFPLVLKPFVRLALCPYFLKTSYIFKNAHAITGVSQKYLNFGLKYAKRVVSAKDKVFPLGYRSVDGNLTNYDQNEFTQLKVCREQINILFVGTFGRTYDLSTIIKAAKYLEKSHPNVMFIFTGDGENMDLWKKESLSLSNIVFTGWVGKRELDYLSSISRVGLMAYAKGAPQGLPNKVFEYMAYGLPILSSLQGETKELLEKEKIGLTYNAGCHKDLLLKFSYLLDNQDSLNEMSQNSGGTFKRKFTSAGIYKKLINHLLEILSSYPKK
ncbi:glycosyltransferase family 4 protein [Akkermansiaceae bacterium]|nr:glycosyltransferase family 4 protein [Akkermansiaceae bacterium]